MDDDVAAAIERLREEQKKPLKAVINETLRRGLSGQQQIRESREPYRTRTSTMGRCRLPNLDDVAEALDIAEGEKHS